jgi:hypothetical protein
MAELLERDPDEADALLSWWDYDEGLPDELDVLVTPDDAVVFLSDDGVQAVLPPGRHHLSAASHPKLAPFMGDELAIAVGFLRTRGVVLELSEPALDMQDPETRLAFGTVVLCEEIEVSVVDAAKLFTALAGPARPSGDTIQGFVLQQATRFAREQFATQQPRLRDLATGPVELDGPRFQAEVNRALMTMGVKLTPRTPLQVLANEEDLETLRKLESDTRPR